MKRLLKPTGQILTTAVFTSTAIDACLPQTANPVPLDSSSPETTPTPEQPTIDASDISEQRDTIAPPEAVSVHTQVASPSPQQGYAELPAPLPTEFFADLEKSNTNPPQQMTAEAIRQQQVATAQPPSLPYDASQIVQSPESLAPTQPIDSASTEDGEPLASVLPGVQVFMPEESDVGTQPTPSSVSEVSISETSDSTLQNSDPIATASSDTDTEAIGNDNITGVAGVTAMGPESSELQDIEEDVLPSHALPSNTVVVTQPPHTDPDSSPTPNSTDDQAVDIEVTLISPDRHSIEPVERREDLSTKPMAEGDRLATDISESTEQPTTGQTNTEQPVTEQPASEQPVNPDALTSSTNPKTTEPTGLTAPAENDTNAVDSTIGNSSGMDHFSGTDHASGTEQSTSLEDSDSTNPSHSTNDDLQETKDWLDAQLEIIVDQSRQRQANESRQRLIEFARQSLELGNITEARQVANNPILTEEEREALRVAIAETSAQEFIPLIPLPDDANGDLGIIGIQPNLPTLESLPTLPTTPLSTPNPIQGRTAIASLSEQLPSLPLSSGGLHQWPLSNAGLPPTSSLTAEELKQCLVGDGDIQVDDQTLATSQTSQTLRTNDIVDGASPRIIASSQALEPMAYIGTGQQPPTTLKTSDAFPVGGDFLAGVGQQPPSILPESSWSGAPVLSADPVPFKWTRAKLNQELEASATEPASKTLSVDCREALARQEQSNIGGPTVAPLTGYQWLSQFAIARPSSSSSGSSSAPGSGSRQRQTHQMILPLPHATPMTSGFGWRSHPIYGGRRFHFGLDYGAPSGTPILASISGRIETTGSLNGYGLTVILENDDLNMRNLYAHMSGIAVQEGTWVEQGTVIGWVGSTGNSTGPHLHFEVHKQSQDGWVAVDPLQAAAELIQLARR